MSALRTWRAVKPIRLSPPSPSKSVKIDLRFKSPDADINFSGKLLTLSHHHPTHLIKMADSHSSLISQSNSSCVDPNYCEIIVVRHGETAWNVDGKIQGHLDVELNEVGREQAVTVADRLAKEFKISAVYSSDLKRALETAKTIANACGGIQVIEDPDLRERHLGDLQGVVYREVAKINPCAYKAFSSHKTDQVIPGGGESYDQLLRRCTSALQRIAQKHKGEKVVVVTHGGTIRALHRRACPNGRSVGKVLNTSLSTFQLSDGDEWTIKSWGDVSHLNRTGFLQSGFGGDGTSG